MSEWQEVTLQDVVSVLGDGLHGTPIYDDKGEYYFVNGNNLSNGKILLKESTRRTSEAEYLKYKKPLNDRTILLSINGTLGNVALYNNEKCFLGKSACYFNVKESVDKQFIRYIVTNKDFQTYITEFAHGTTIQNLSLKTLREFPFELPPLTEQKAIASVLSSLDDKIDLLHRQNTTLERMAETLFRQWFVEDAQDSNIGQFIDLQNGYAFKSQDFKDIGEQRVLKIKNISGGIIDVNNTDFIDSSVANKTDAKFKVLTGDILFAMTGAEIGKLGIVPKTNTPLWLNQRVGLLKEKFKGARFLAYLQLNSDIGQDYIENSATGSAQPNISGSLIEQCPFPKVEVSKIKECSEILDVYYQKLISNLGQIQTLEKLRDNLLPKLISGETRVDLEGASA